MPGRSRGPWRGPGAPVQNADWNAAQNTIRPEKVQIVDIDGHPLRHSRERVDDALSLASSSVWRWAVDRWSS